MLPPFVIIVILIFLFAYLGTVWSSSLSKNTYTYIGQPMTKPGHSLMLGGYRYYHPGTKIFFKQDSYSPFVTSFTSNGFNYGLGNPIATRDASGHLPESEIELSELPQRDLDNFGPLALSDNSSNASLSSSSGSSDELPPLLPIEDDDSDTDDDQSPTLPSPEAPPHDMSYDNFSLYGILRELKRPPYFLESFPISLLDPNQIKTIPRCFEPLTKILEDEHASDLQKSMAFSRIKEWMDAVEQNGTLFSAKAIEGYATGLSEKIPTKLLQMLHKRDSDEYSMHALEARDAFNKALGFDILPTRPTI